HDLGWAHHVRLHPGTSAAVQVRDGVPGGGPAGDARPLPHRSRELLEPAERRFLHGLHGRDWIAPVAWLLECVPVARAQLALVDAARPEDRQDPRRADRRRVSRDPNLGVPVRSALMVQGAERGTSPEVYLEATESKLDARVPAGPIAQKWDNRKFDNRLVAPANRRRYTILVVGTGLAGASAAATLGEQGYNVKSFCIHESPRRAHSIAAQGGINAATNYRNDGDSVRRLFYDTVKGGDYRSREANVYRLAQLSVDIIDQCVAQGVPFAREYSGYLETRSFG